MKKILILGIVSLVALSSCTKFLEPNSPSEYTPETAASLDELLLGEAYPTYNNTQDHLESFLGLMEDDVDAAPWANNGPIIWNMGIFQSCYSWQPDMFTSFRDMGVPQAAYNTWLGNYSRIKGTNVVLDDLPQVSGSDAEKNSVKAQALALRAFYYFQLVNTYGAPYNYDKTALGVPLKLQGLVSTTPMPRNTVEEVYSQVLSDLLEAEKLYISIPNYQWKPDYKVSLPMVQLLLSRVYLYQEDWANAATYAEKVMANTHFALKDLNAVPASQPDIPYFNFLNYENNSEVIWLYGYYDDAFYFTWGQSKVSYDYTYSDPWSTYSAVGSRPLFKASDALLNLYDSTDLRPSLYIMSNPVDLAGDNGYKIAKGKIAVASKDLGTPSLTFARAYRLSEAYLNGAEAYAELGQTSKSLDLLNALRSKRYKVGSYVAESGLSGNALIAEVRNERRRELCFEGHRWFDQRREGMHAFSRVWHTSGNAADDITYTILSNDRSFVVPIPQEALAVNPQLIQNPLSPKR